MADIIARSEVRFAVTLTLSESEARALDALAGYGADSFLETFYKLGRHYMEPYEPGLRKLFDSIRGGPGTLSSALASIDDARRVLKNEQVRSSAKQPVIGDKADTK